MSGRARGRRSVRFRQTHKGIPVIAGELVVSVDAARATSCPPTARRPTPRPSTPPPAVSAVDARRAARSGGGQGAGRRPSARCASSAGVARRLRPAAARRARARVSPVSCGAPRWRPTPGRSTSWCSSTPTPARSPSTSTSTPRPRTAGSATATTFPARRGLHVGLRPGRGPGRRPAIADVDRAYDFSGQTYDFYFSKFGRDSLDNAGLILRSTVRFCPDAFNCPFAERVLERQPRWSTATGFASVDDVVGHELTHGVTDFESEPVLLRPVGRDQRVAVRRVRRVRRPQQRRRGPTPPPRAG